MKLRKFTRKFYEDKKDCWTEMLQKDTRPYLVVEIIVNDCNCYIPLRSHVADRHENCFITVPPAGLDYSKSIFLTDAEIVLYIDLIKSPVIDPKEFRIVSRNEKLIKQGMEKYLTEYKDARKRLDLDKNRLFVSRSTLQYFENFIYTEEEKKELG